MLHKTPPRAEVPIAPCERIRYAVLMTGDNSVQPVAERLTITGPAGPIEVLIETPSAAPSRAIGVICHPHPLHGGAMTNKVVHMLARAFNEAQAIAVRFNFRGVGGSAGVYDHGRGETDDALAVVGWAQERAPDLPLWLGGFSFGGAVAICASMRLDVARLITVAPAIDRVDVSSSAPQAPWLLVQGERDELVDAQAVQQWAATLARPPRLQLLPEVDHFFHGRLNVLKDVVVSWLNETNAARE